MTGPLEGVRILDLTSGVAGPMATMTLGDQGADVIKVELPNGDPFRRYGGYTVWNRGKRSIALDLKREADHDKFLDLVVSADVLIEGYAPGTMGRLGLAYNDLKAHNAGLVYCSLTGYGRHTKNSGRPGYDLLVQARSTCLLRVFRPHYTCGRLLAEVSGWRHRYTRVFSLSRPSSGSGANAWTPGTALGRNHSQPFSNVLMVNGCTLCTWGVGAEEIGTSCGRRWG